MWGGGGEEVVVLGSWDRRVGVDKSYITLQTVTQKNFSITKPPIIFLRFCFQGPIEISFLYVRDNLAQTFDLLPNT